MHKAYSKVTGISPTSSNVEQKDSLDTSLRRLDRLGAKLSKLGLQILTASIVNVGCLALLYMHSVLSAFWLAGVSVVVGGFTLVFSAVYDLAKREGDALFEEISDELQWKIASASHSEVYSRVEIDEIDQHAKARPELNARVVLRTFASSTELPLIPGRYGAALYVAINIFISFSAIQSARQMLFFGKH